MNAKRSSLPLFVLIASFLATSAAVTPAYLLWYLMFQNVGFLQFLLLISLGAIGVTALCVRSRGKVDVGSISKSALAGLVGAFCGAMIWPARQLIFNEFVEQGALFRIYGITLAFTSAIIGACISLGFHAVSFYAWHAIRSNESYKGDAA